MKKNINDVRNGKITSDEYADNIINIEVEGVVNQILVASELGINQESEFQQELANEYSEGNITKKGIIKQIKSVIGRLGTDEGNARDNYTAQGEMLRRIQLKREKDGN